MLALEQDFCQCLIMNLLKTNSFISVVSPTTADLQAVSSVFQGVTFLTATAFLQQSLVLVSVK